MTQEKSILTQLRQDRKILWIAVGCGLLAAILLSFHLQKGQGEMVEVVVAKKPIPPGGTISPETVAIRSIPKEFASPGVITREDNLAEFGDLTSAIPIQPGAQILRAYIRTPEVKTSFARELSPEMRLITIAIDEVKGVSRNLQPNDLVDVLWTGALSAASRGGTGNIVTRVLLEGVTVAAVGSGKSGLAASVTLMLSQEEAAKLVFAENAGQIRLVLRHPHVIPDSIVTKGKKEISYSDLADPKTVSTDRMNLMIEIFYGKEKRR